MQVPLEDLAVSKDTGFKMKGTGFSPYVWLFKRASAIQTAERLDVPRILHGFVTGHDFSRAAKPAIRLWALAPEGYSSGSVRFFVCLFLATTLTLAPSFFAQDVPQASSTPPAAPTSDSFVVSRPIAIIPLDSKDPDAGTKVAGALEISKGHAIIAASGTVTSGTMTTQVTLPYRGVLRVCASTTVKLAADSSIPSGEIPGLMMAMDHGAVEASFATGHNSDILMTPDFRILIGGPGAVEVKVRLGTNGDTCIDNAGVNAPYVLVSSVFDGGAYRVQPGQRVMFEHGNLHDVVDQEKEPCGCPPPPQGVNDFPLAQSEGLAPLAAPALDPGVQPGKPQETTTTLAYSGADHAPKPVEPEPKAATPATAPAPPPEKKPGFFGRVGKFFRRIFGAE
jgi:hypothetical protein